jgi:eukaryotic-like serine/threonine-protein kinase
VIVSNAERLSAALSDRYRIERELGTGGMATVYLAEDVKHDRKVAIKVLKPELTAVLGADRFIQEIKTTASLQHPHILPLFDSGTADGFLFYVMPYIEGETLRDKLDRETQLGIDEAVRITREVADALDYAHRHGIIHRDIKPENILLHDGRPVVADFGIALALSAAAGGRMTETGTSIGTPHYMSPEQATGDKQITGRADIYSLASVLYEMLTGSPPHVGSSAQQVIMKIIAEPVQPVTALRKSVPPNVAAAVMQALEKLPADRFESAKEFADALADPGFTSVAAAASLAGRVGRGGVPVPLFAGALALFLGAAAFAAVGWMRTPERDAQVIRFTQPVPAGTHAQSLDVSPDGSTIVFSDDITLNFYVRALDEDTATQLGQGVGWLRFSPSGRDVIGSTGSEVKVIPLGGGPMRTFDGALGPTIAVGPDGSVYGGGAAGVLRIMQADGSQDTLRTGGERVVYPQEVMPGGRGIIVQDDENRVLIFDLDSRTFEELFQIADESTVRLGGNGYLLYVEGSRLLARRFDPDRRTLGEPFTIADGGPGAYVDFGIGGTTLAWSFRQGVLMPSVVDRRGQGRPLANLSRATYTEPSISPDGRRIAMLRTAVDGSGTDVWVYELSTGTSNRLTRSGDLVFVAWAPDGEHVAYLRDFDLYWQRFDGSGQEEHLLHRDRFMRRFAFTPDGKRVVFQEEPTAWDLGIATLGTAGSDSLILRGDYWEGTPAIDPSGRWLAYYSNENGDPQIYIQPLSGAGRRVRVSRGTGVFPRWSHDGHALFFTDGLTLMTARLVMGEDSALTPVGETPLFDVSEDRTYDVFPGDSLFVVTRSPDNRPSSDRDIRIVANVDVLLRQLESRPR